MAELKHPIREAERYLQNARQILSEKAGKEGGYYGNKTSRPLLGAYESLHKALGYDGNPRYKVVQDSLEQANLMISRADKQYRDE